MSKKKLLQFLAGALLIASVVAIPADVLADWPANVDRVYLPVQSGDGVKSASYKTT